MNYSVVILSQVSKLSFSHVIEFLRNIFLLQHVGGPCEWKNIKITSAQVLVKSLGIELYSIHVEYLLFFFFLWRNSDDFLSPVNRFNQLLFCWLLCVLFVIVIYHKLPSVVILPFLCFRIYEQSICLKTSNDTYFCLALAPSIMNAFFLRDWIC